MAQAVPELCGRCTSSAHATHLYDEGIESVPKTAESTLEHRETHFRLYDIVRSPSPDDQRIAVDTEQIDRMCEITRRHSTSVLPRNAERRANLGG